MPAATPATPRRGRPPSGGREAVLAATLELLRERGAGRLTTRAVAARAGVSEGSVFYHFGDRAGLLTAVIEDGLGDLHALGRNGIKAGGLLESIDGFLAAVEHFLDRALAVMIAAQSDFELRTSLAVHLVGNDLGPHRGVQGLAAYLRSEQAAGVVAAEADVDSAAYFAISSCFMRVSQRQMIGPDYGADLAGRAQLVDALVTMLSPPGAGPGAPSVRPLPAVRDDPGAPG